LAFRKLPAGPTRRVGQQRERVFGKRRQSPLFVHAKSFSHLYMNLYQVLELQLVEMLDALFRDVRLGYRLRHPVGFVLRCLLVPRPPLVDVEFLRSLLPQAKALSARLGLAVSWVESPSGFECRLSWYLPGENACFLATIL